MGQAAIDLPDPLEPGATTGNADDLLAQLAGEEVDRLLAEADLDSTTRKPAEVATPEVVAGSANNAPLAEAPATESTALQSQSPTHSRAQAVADELEADEAMQGSLNATASTNGAFSDEPEADSSDEREAPLPILVRPLAWLNAPLELLPDAIRELIGKIALLTMFNAVAVIVYVLIFRKHGH